MLSSFTLRQRNNDPDPYLPITVTVDGKPTKVKVHRVKFQHGKLGTNPILVEARVDYELKFIHDFGMTEQWAREQLDALSGSKAFPNTRTGKRVAHARRVFELLIAISKEES